jgi:hypothetical protein
MDVEEDHAVTFPQIRTIEATKRPADFVQHPGRNVTWNDRIRDAAQPTMPKVNVGAAHFGPGGTKQRASGRHVRALELSDFNRPPRSRHDGGEDAIAHVVR